MGKYINSVSYFGIYVSRFAHRVKRQNSLHHSCCSIFLWVYLQIFGMILKSVDRMSTSKSLCGCEWHQCNSIWLCITVFQASVIGVWYYLPCSDVEPVPRCTSRLWAKEIYLSQSFTYHPMLYVTKLGGLAHLRCQSLW